jgi:hypothetical protein
MIGIITREGPLSILKILCLKKRILAFFMLQKMQTIKSIV